MERDLRRVADWISSNGLRMNVAKTQLMVLSRKGRRDEANSVQVKVGNDELKKDCARYLGMEIDRDLTWKAHIERMHRQCMGKLAVIRRVGSYLPCHIRKLLYQSFVLSHLDYCSVVWNNCGATLTGRVERIQNYALRMILCKPPPTSSELLRQILGWTTLKARGHNAMLCQVHRCCTNQAPPNLCSKFTPNSDLNYIRTRGSNKLYLPRPQTNFYHSSFEFQGAMHFNNLPENIRVIKGCKQFKAALLEYNNNIS